MLFYPSAHESARGAAARRRKAASSRRTPKRPAALPLDAGPTAAAGAAAGASPALECGGSTPLFFSSAGVLARFGVRHFLCRFPSERSGRTSATVLRRSAGAGLGGSAALERPSGVWSVPRCGGPLSRRSAGNESGEGIAALQSVLRLRRWTQTRQRPPMPSRALRPLWSAVAPTPLFFSSAGVFARFGVRWP